MCQGEASSKKGVPCCALFDVPGGRGDRLLGSGVRAGILSYNGASWITLENIAVEKAERGIADHESVDLRLDYKADLWLNLISNAFYECEGNVYEMFNFSKPPELDNNHEDKVGSSWECRGIYRRLSCADKDGVDKVDIWDIEVDNYLKKLATISKEPFPHCINMILESKKHHEKNKQLGIVFFCFISNSYEDRDELKRRWGGIICYHLKHKLDPSKVIKVVFEQILGDVVLGHMIGVEKIMMNMEEDVKKTLMGGICVIL